VPLPAGHPNSSACIGKCRATSVPAHLLRLDSMSSRSNAQPRTARTCRSSARQTTRRSAIGVVNHCNTVVEPAEHVAAADPQARGIHPQGAAVISTDCGFGREGLSRRIASTSAWPWSGHQHRPPRARPAERACGRPIENCGSPGLRPVALLPGQSWGRCRRFAQSGS